MFSFVRNMIVSKDNLSDDWLRWNGRYAWLTRSLAYRPTAGLQ